MARTRERAKIRAVRFSLGSELRSHPAGSVSCSLMLPEKFDASRSETWFDSRVLLDVWHGCYGGRG